MKIELYRCAECGKSISYNNFENNRICNKCRKKSKFPLTDLEIFVIENLEEDDEIDIND